jgi:hypothetical protein
MVYRMGDTYLDKMLSVPFLYDEMDSVFYKEFTLMRESAAAIAAEADAEIARLREWRHYPIDMPLTAEGMGPATIGVDAASVVYEVWDENCTSHGAFPNLRAALDLAMRLNAAPDGPA